MNGIGGSRVDDFRNTLAGRAYIGGAEKSGPVNSPVIQLWNPAASGFNLVLNRITTVSDAPVTALYKMGYHNAAMSGAESQANKYLGGAAGVGLVKSQDTGFIGTAMFTYNSPPGVEHVLLANSDPIWIPEGLGEFIYLYSAANKLSVIFEWIEVPA